jgi:hypothetical protein
VTAFADRFEKREIRGMVKEKFGPRKLWTQKSLSP